MSLYDLGMMMASGITGISGRFINEDKSTKIKSFISGRKGLFDKIESDLQLIPGKKTIWVHAASLGEFAIVRPIINELKEKYECNFVITFFSPSGYEAVKRKDCSFNNVFYLPWDTKKNASKLISLIQPDLAIWCVSEYWHNYLSELHRLTIPVFLLSAIISRESVFFKNYGKNYRKDLYAFTNVFTMDEETIRNLKALGYTHGVMTGDPLFDNAYKISKKDYINPTVENFKNNNKLIVCGSIDLNEDLKLVKSLNESFQNVKFLIVPHETDKNTLCKLTESLPGNSITYSNAKDSKDLDHYQNLIIDYTGELAYLYRYGTIAYIGGGFTKYLHSILEAAVYGLPVSFGPIIHRKTTARQLIDLGAGTIVKSGEEIINWAKTLLDDENKRASIKATEMQYIADNINATAKAVEIISQYL